jgi:uncharacterized OB-fold protein/acyl dehydratase
MTASPRPAPAAADSLAERLSGFEGREAGPVVEAPDEVNQAMIRHWVEAMGDENAVYVDDEAARAAGFSGVVAPAVMLQAWIMRGYRRSMEAEAARAGGGTSGAGAAQATALDELFRLLDEAGFTSVVATDCQQEYLRPLVIGDRLRARSTIEAVSPEKRTALGPGHFVTTLIDFADASGETVATMRFRILRFRPRSAQPSRSAEPSPPHPSPAQPPERPLRPRPAVTPDTAFFFEGARQGKLLVQRCASCSRLRHPPAPACRWCHSLEWDTVQSSRRATLYSYVVVHHPQVPAFDYPLVVGLAELEEGTRLVADMIDVEPQEVSIGMTLEVALHAYDDELTLPVLRPAPTASPAPKAMSDPGAR